MTVDRPVVELTVVDAPIDEPRAPNPPTAGGRGSPRDHLWGAALPREPVAVRIIGHVHQCSKATTAKRVDGVTQAEIARKVARTIKHRTCLVFVIITPRGS